MYFKRLEMQGFKSFADPVTIELNDGITCIVGPNGSGKSNISDALRWVLGEQSPKLLRGGKMEEVIFAGTATRKPKGMAEVTLVIDNSTGILPLEYKEVAVTRRMYRSGESEYLINGNQCRLRDIKELFMDTGIGVDGYSIIGQGKIQDIVSTKPENRREIFEEAAGVVLYKSRKAEAERKLKTASDNLERVSDIIGEIESRIGGLKEDSEKATEFIGLRDRYKYLSVNIILHNVSGLQRNIEQGEIDLKEIADRIAETTKEADRLAALVESQRVEDAELGDKLEELNKELLEKVEELHLISNRGQVNTEKLQAIERDLERLTEVISDSETRLASEREDFKELEENEKSFARERDEAEKALNQAIFKLNEHTAKAGEIDEQVERDKGDIIDLNNKNVSKNAEITTLDIFMGTLRERSEQLKAEFEGRDETNARNKENLAAIEANLASKENELASANSEIEQVSNNILSANEAIAAFSEQIEADTIELNRAIARRATIEEMEHNYEGYSSAVKALMQKSFSGIVGTVSDLIKVPDGYELAVETALGNNLQNIVCRTDDDAKEAIEWLKASKSGRATFLPVESVTADPIDTGSAVTSMKGYIGIASDIVGIDSKYDEILEYLLCRVVLADNMDNAIAISKKIPAGFRIVTLEGEIINTAGAITGGKYKNKTANLLERKKEIEELAVRIDALKAALDKAVGDRDGKNAELRSLKDRRTELYDVIQQCEIERNVLASERDHAARMIEEASEASGKYEEEINTIAGDIERASAMIDKYKAEIAENDKAVKALEEKVEAGLEESEKFRAVIDEDNEEIVRCRMLFNEQDTKILSQNELIERVRDTIQDLEMTLADSREEYETLSKQRVILTGSGAESDEKAEVLAAEREKIEEEIAAVTASIDSNRAQHEKSLADQRKCSADLSDMQDEKYKLEIKQTRNETILGTQKDKLWDEFEISFAEANDMREEGFAITAGNKEAREIRVRMAELGDVNISAIEEYKAVSKRYEFMTAQRDDITKAMSELKSIISNMDKTIKEKFKENFDKVVINFEESFKALFGGGTAELRLEDESNPLESGIEIIAQPPGKKLKNINLMSGGEKTLTAIALMFAVLKAKPTPFCILDEVEAALDEANIERFSDYLKNFDDVQFALITHQKATMEHADVLYGVTMPEQGISRLLSLRFADEFDTEGLS